MDGFHSARESRRGKMGDGSVPAGFNEPFPNRCVA